MSGPRAVLLGVVLCVVSQSALAAEAVVARAPISQGGSSWDLTVAGAMIVAGGTANPGLQLGVATPVSVARDLNLWVGGNVGMFFTSSPFNMVFLPLPEAYLRFDASPRVHPRAGIEAGIALTTGGGPSALRFAMFFKPGIDVWMTDDISLNFEPKLGIIGSDFAFAPQLGVTIGL